MATRKMGAVVVVKQRGPQLRAPCVLADNKDGPLHTAVAGGRVGRYHGCCLSYGC